MAEEKRIFITGITGFIGSELLKSLIETPRYRLVLLVRDPDRLPFSNHRGVDVVTGDLLEPDTYSRYLRDVDTVIHLAAVTGKAPGESYQIINARGTGMLLEAARNAGVRQFLFMSTIAVTYPDKYRYFYAQSKEEAEKIVAVGGLNYCILRPTIIVDQGSSNFQLLKRLSRFRFIPLPARIGVRIQPVSLSDVVNAILYILEKNRFKDELVDLGGPDQIFFIDFINLIHISYTSRFPFIFFLPHQLIKKLVGFFETMAYKFLPVSAGQMASFGNDSIATPSELLDVLQPEMMNIAGILSRGLDQPSGGIESILAAECKTFSNYLLGVSPDDYITTKYIQANFFRSSRDSEYGLTFDLVLLKFARYHPFTTRIANAYSTLFTPRSLLLRKLTLLLSILEYAPLTCQYFDETASHSLQRVLFKVVFGGISFIVTLFLSLIFLGPLHLLNRQPAVRSKQESRYGKS